MMHKAIRWVGLCSVLIATGTGCGTTPTDAIRTGLSRVIPAGAASLGDPLSVDAFQEPEAPVFRSAEPVAVSERNFDEQVLQSDAPVLVDFWAPWCGPCRDLAPVVDQIAMDNQGNIRVAKVNVDDNPALARQYQVTGIPRLVLFNNGQAVQHMVGVHSRDSIQRWMDNALSGAGTSGGSDGKPGTDQGGKVGSSNGSGNTGGSKPSTDSYK